MAKVLQVDCSTGSGFIEKDFGVSTGDIYISVDVAINAAALSALIAGFAENDIIEVTSSTFQDSGIDWFVDTGPVLKWAAYNNGSTGDPAGTPLTPSSPITDMQFYRVIMHVVPGSPIAQDVTVDGVSIPTLDVTGTNQANVKFLDLVNPGILTAGGLMFFDNIAIGSFPGGSDIFSDDFEGGDLSNWTTIDPPENFSVIDDPGITPAGETASTSTIEPGKFIYKWTILHFNYDGTSPIEADYSGYSYDVTSNEVFHASSRNINFYLNGVDDAGFTLYLDDPMAALITPTKSMIKIYRTVYDADGETILYADDDTFPCFAGTVGSTLKDGEANTMQVKCFSPLWRLQSRFHVRNHYLVIDADTTEPYTGSGLIFKLISLLNDAFPATGDAYTGIEQGVQNWADEPEMSPYFVAKGSNTWALIYDDIMSRPAAADLVPIYNDDGSNIAMILDTDEKRGTDNTATAFNYHMGTDDNCNNVTQEIAVNPGEFANFLWAIGQGGANSGKVAVAWDNASGDFDSNSIGLYMKTLDKSEVKRVKALVPIAKAELAQSRWPKFAYNVELAPFGGLIYNLHFTLGDVIQLRADKGALQVNKNQRIYQVGLTMSDNNVEIVSPLVSNDFYGKVGPSDNTVVPVTPGETDILQAIFTF